MKRILPATALYTNIHYIPFEEKMMEKTFGQKYLEYSNKVRRWI